MKLEDYADCINATIKIDRTPYGRGSWKADFEHCEIKRDIFLTSGSGDGLTPELAMKAFVENIRGKTLVFDAMRETRREFLVPESLTV